MIGQKFPPEILEIARKKLEGSDWSNEYVHVTRHALDMFSKRFLDLWLAVCKLRIETGVEVPGLATFVAQYAKEAWDKGNDISKHRHQDDGTTKQYDGLKWVFSVNSQFPDYREVITIMLVSE